MYFFSITLVAMCAAATLFALSAMYSAIQGVPYFLDSEIPAAVFLGLHLLITDPSTSPRSLVGKAIFGVLYGVGVFLLYALLGWLGAPTFYDKLLCVPLLNLSVIGIDRLAQKIHSLTPWRPKWNALGFNLRYMAVWIVFFLGMTLLHKTDGMHVGDSLPFWRQACAENRVSACERMLLLQESYCRNGAAWACNELGIHYRRGEIETKNDDKAMAFFSRSCELRFLPACENILHSETALQDHPKTLDLRLMLREGGQNLMTMSEPELMARACKHGWLYACDSVSAP